MRIPRRLFLTFALALAGAASASSQEGGKIRVACVGDSITFGACVADRGNNCYPAVLGKLLGDRYEVRNFGVSGSTLLKKGDKPYWKEKAFTQATDFNPSIVVIKLGTNDTKPQNWKHKGEIEADARAMVRHFMELAGKPKVFVALPVPVLKPNFGINQEGVAQEIPVLRKVAKEEGAGLIDLHSAVAAPDLFDKDGVHPNAAGAKKIAETVHAALK
jgi:lysophospholipase L1-like esterase